MTVSKTATAQAPAWIAVAPGVFVFLWSTGFIGAKYGLPYAGPLTFLLVRFALVLAILLPVALLARAPWPDSPRRPCTTRRAEQVSSTAGAAANIHLRLCQPLRPLR